MHLARFPAALLLALLAACGRGGEGEKGPPDAAQMDTTNESPIDGLSREQIQRTAQPMTPEQAEALGIVDSTIHVESMSSDSGPPPARTDGAPPRAPAAPAAPPDTAP